MNPNEDEDPRLFVVEIADTGKRLDAFLAQKLVEQSRSRIQKAIEAGEARVNSLPRKTSYRVQSGDNIEIDALSETEIALQVTPENIPLDIVYEDEHILVVNKPRGMVTHPAVGSTSGTLVNALLGYSVSLSTVGGSFRPGIVHRLDKDTSGLLLAAKTDAAHLKLAKAMENRTIERRYLALVWGEPKWEKLRVDAPIGRSDANRKKMAIMDEEGKGRTAVTDFTVHERFVGFTLLEAKLHTGRTHQIRVHANYAHHAVVGDTVYGGDRPIPKDLFDKTVKLAIEQAIENMNGQALMAYSLSFKHPITSEQMSFEIIPPAPFLALLNVMKPFVPPPIVPKPPV